MKIQTLYGVWQVDIRMPYPKRMGRGKPRFIKLIRRNKVKRNKLYVILPVCILLLVALLVPTQVSGQESTSVNTDSSVSISDRGPYFDTIMSAALLPGAIQNELMAKGLVNIKYDKQGKAIGGRVDVDAIAKMIDSGVYWVDKQKHLREDTIIESDNFSPRVITANEYRYGSMGTVTNNYRGDICYATIPSSITLGAGTTHILYSTHLALGDTSHWIEAGIIWANWLYDNGPALFTYDTYGNGYQWTYIPAGVQREVYLNIQVYSDYHAELYARDSYSGLTMYTWTSQVNTLNGNADEGEEQYSSSYTYTPTSPVMIDRSKLKNTSGNWINWSNSISTGFRDDNPLWESHGISNGMRWVQPWSAP